MSVKVEIERKDAFAHLWGLKQITPIDRAIYLLHYERGLITHSIGVLFGLPQANIDEALSRMNKQIDVEMVRGAIPKESFRHNARSSGLTPRCIWCREALKPGIRLYCGPPCMNKHAQSEHEGDTGDLTQF